MPARTILTTLHGRPVPAVPRWAARTACAITLLALPSSGSPTCRSPPGARSSAS
ncbi:hypothetical protein [Streptomyces sp. bgisy084]|uniref:hypothetical protein n=1 Tax=unclassified Streptomyces TaxID=2593676 RepID=UPI003D7237FD